MVFAVYVEVAVGCTYTLLAWVPATYGTVAAGSAKIVPAGPVQVAVGSAV